MGPKTAQTLTRGLNFQSIVTAIYVSYACEQFDKSVKVSIFTRGYGAADRGTARISLSFEYTCSSDINFREIHVVINKN